MADDIYRGGLQEDCAAGADPCYISDEDMYGSSGCHGEDEIDFGCSHVSNELCDSGVAFTHSESDSDQRGGASHGGRGCDRVDSHSALMSRVANMHIHSSDSGTSRDSAFFSYETHCCNTCTSCYGSSLTEQNNNQAGTTMPEVGFSYTANCNANSQCQLSGSWPSDSVQFVDADGDTQLQLAVTQRRDDIVTELLECDLPPDYVNYRDANGRTALNLAALTNQPELFPMLLKHRADPYFCDLNGDTPLHVACRNGFLECVRTLVTFITFLYPSSEHDPNTRNYNGFTCLHLAAANRHYDVTSFLVNRFHVDINARDGCSGRTILHHAADRGDRDFVEFLLMKFPNQLNINACAHDKRTTPLNLARGREFDDIVMLLEKKGAVKVSDYDLYSDSDSDSDTEMYS